MSNALVETGAMEPLSFMVLARAKISATTNNHGLFPNPFFLRKIIDMQSPKSDWTNIFF